MTSVYAFLTVTLSDKFIGHVLDPSNDTSTEISGFVVTQATVSRDIKKLGLVKVKGKGSHQKYAPKAASTLVEYDKYVRVLKDAITGMDDAENILVIKTVPGMAMAVAAALDSLRIPEIIGSIAGDDTIMCATKNNRHAKDVMDKIRLMI